MRRIAIMLALFLALAGTARAGFGVQFPSGPDPAVAKWPHWPYATACSQLPFDPVSVFGGPTGAENGPGQPEAALRAFLQADVYREVPKRFWRLAALSETRAEFVSGRLWSAPYLLVFERVAGQWTYTGVGDCSPRSVRNGLAASSWTLDADSPEPRATSRTIWLQAREAGCNSGSSPNLRIQEPGLEFRRHKLLVTIWVNPLPPGPQTCVERIGAPYRLHLPRPLGDRTVWDAGTYPPRRATRLRIRRPFP